jgi:LmbE family N-acetylglucosaminyl deacetylase
MEIAAGQERRKEIMLNVTFARPRDSLLRILCLGAHGDDIEIGCGGTILRLIAENPAAEVYWIVLGAAGLRKEEAAASAEFFLAGARRKEIVIREFRDGYFPFIGAAIKDFFEELKEKYSPDLILTHCRNDLHQDHKVVCDLTWNTFRNHLILEYEIVKYDGDFGSPNFFVPLTQAVAQEKIRIILDCFKSQKNKSWFTADAFSSILRLRGLESNAPEKYAEGYYCRKIVC